MITNKYLSIFFLIAGVIIYILGSYIPAINNGIILPYNLKLQLPVSIFSFGIIPYFIGLIILSLTAIFYTPLYKLKNGSDKEKYKFKKINFIITLFITAIAAFILIRYLDDKLDSYYLIYDNMSIFLVLFFVLEMIIGQILTIIIAEFLTRKSFITNGYILILACDFLILLYKHIKPINF